MNTILRTLGGLIIIAIMLVVGSAHHRPTHPIPPGIAKKTTTTTIPPTTTTTISPSTTTTTLPPTTTTTVPATTTTVPVTTTTTTVPGDTNLIIEADTLFTAPIILGPGSTITFSNGAELLCGAGCHVEWDGITATGEGNVRFIAGSGASTILNSTFDLQPALEPGHHPLHWHLVGDGSRGTLVENVTVMNSTNRAFVPHGSHGISFIGIRAENISDDAFWWNFPGSNGTCVKGVGCDPIDNSNDILVDGAVFDGVHGGRGVAAFVLGAGDNNTIRNTTVLNVTSTNPSQRFCSGFRWPEFTNGSSRGANIVWTFENNKVFNPNSECDGINVWQNDGEVHLIDGFEGAGIDHGAYGNRYLYRNVNVTNVLVHAAGWRIEDSHVGDVVTARHRSERSVADPTIVFDNVTVDSFTIRNAGNSGVIPGIYVLNGSGLSCADIIYDNVVPGTTVIIDGTVC